MFKQNQPHGFSIFFLTEMWERYGFYILQSLLVFYALQQLHLDDKATYAIVGSFTALAYINSIFGGLIADRFIGYDKAIIIGAILLCLGYTILTTASLAHPEANSLLVEQPHGEKYLVVILGLAIVTVGTGMLKPNISSMLSILYQEDPQKKEVGYTLFYVGIYFGAIGGSFLGGFIKAYLGWIAVFSSAAIGLAIALITFRYGQRKFKFYDNRPLVHTKAGSIKAAAALCALAIVAFFGIMNDNFATVVFCLITLFSIFFIISCIRGYSGILKTRLIAFGILTIFSVLYWAVYFQQFFSVSLCTSRVTQLSFPASSLTAFESLGVILFGPLVNGLWLFLQRHRRDLSIPAKFSLSFLFNSLSFLILILSLHYALTHGALQNQSFIIISYLVIALGELFIAPIGLAMVSTLVPPKLHGAMMGIFLMSIGLGGKLAGWLAQTSASNVMASIPQLETIYRDSFVVYFWFSVIACVLCIVAIKPLNHLIQESKLT